MLKQWAPQWTKRPQVVFCGKWPAHLKQFPLKTRPLRRARGSYGSRFIRWSAPSISRVESAPVVDCWLGSIESKEIFINVEVVIKVSRADRLLIIAADILRTISDFREVSHFQRTSIRTVAHAEEYVTKKYVIADDLKDFVLNFLVKVMVFPSQPLSPKLCLYCVWSFFWKLLWMAAGSRLNSDRACCANLDDVGKHFF